MKYSYIDEHQPRVLDRDGANLDLVIKHAEALQAVVKKMRGCAFSTTTEAVLDDFAGLFEDLLADTLECARDSLNAREQEIDAGAEREHERIESGHITKHLHAS